MPVTATAEYAFTRRQGAWSIAHDLAATGHTHITAINPVTEAGAAAAVAESRKVT